MIIADVTPSSFAVIWTASEPSTCTIKVFADQNGSFEITQDVAVQSMPVSSGDSTIIQQAESNGVMKVRVSQLEAGATYYFQTVTTSKSTADVTLFPDMANLSMVTLADRASRGRFLNASLVPFANDLLQVDCYLPDNITPATGTLLLAYVYGSKYPLSSFVGDGSPTGMACIDLNNSYSENTMTSLYIPGGQSVQLLHYMGTLGQMVDHGGIPCSQQMVEPKSLINKTCRADFSGSGSVDGNNLRDAVSSLGIQHNFSTDMLPVWGDLDLDGDTDGLDVSIVSIDTVANCPVCEE
jgi:hypothetical protein